LRNLSFRVVSSGIFSVPYLCGEILKDIIPCMQNEQQTLSVMKTRVRQESSQRKVFYLFFMFPPFKKEDECFSFVFFAESKITDNLIIKILRLSYSKN